MLINSQTTIIEDLPDSGEFVTDKEGRDRVIGYLGETYNNVSYQKTSENSYLVKFSDKRK